MNELEKRLRQGPGYEADSAAAADELKAAAARLGLVDVAYALEPSPLGTLLLAATPRGLVRVAYGADQRLDEVLERLASRLSPRVLEQPAELDSVRRQLDEYFAGRRTRFELPLDRRLTHGFTRRVLEAASRIGYGQTASYREVAARAGSERAVRAAGNALGANPIPIVVPCHRVLRTGGALGGYTGGLDRKRYLLRLEGVLD